jgi:hypothetical protein
MKDFNYYKTCEKKLPIRADHTTIYVYDKGTILAQITESKYRKEDYPQSSVIQKSFDKESYNEERTSYYTELAQKREEFRNDLFEEFDIVNHPKAETALEISTRISESDDFEKIYEIFEEIIVLIQ